MGIGRWFRLSWATPIIAQKVLLSLSETKEYGYSKPIFFSTLISEPETVTVAARSNEPASLFNHMAIGATIILTDNNDKTDPLCISKDPESNTLQISYNQEDEIALDKIVLPTHEQISGVVFSSNKEQLYLGTKNGTIFSFKRSKSLKDEDSTVTADLYARKKRKQLAICSLVGATIILGGAIVSYTSCYALSKVVNLLFN